VNIYFDLSLTIGSPYQTDYGIKGFLGFETIIGVEVFKFQ